MRIPEEVLTEELIEEIKTRLCFVGEDDTRSGGATPTEEQSHEPDEDETALLRRLEQRFAASSEATTITIRVPSLSQPPVLSGVGRGWIQIPGWVRERAAEVLFEEGDDDEYCLTELVLESLLKVSPQCYPSSSIVDLTLTTPSSRSTFANLSPHPFWSLEGQQCYQASSRDFTLLFLQR